MTTNPLRAWFALFGVACSLLANVTGEVYPAHGRTARQYRSGGPNYRTARHLMRETDHALEEIDDAISRVAAGNSVDQQLRPGSPAAGPASRGGFALTHLEVTSVCTATTSIARSYDLDAAVPGRAPPVWL